MYIYIKVFTYIDIGPTYIPDNSPYFLVNQNDIRPTLSNSVELKVFITP